jgi:tRNA pseudouridine55 synthase
MTAPALSGVLLLDKPLGWTSNAALGRARRLLGGVKAGHTGTLDPFASGLLPITVGEAGKFSRYSLDADKRYEATLKLGAISTTGDPEGVVSATGKDLPGELPAVEGVLRAFLGEQDQIPPMHSALKQQGVPLYELARKGLEVARAPRRIHVHALNLLDWRERDTLKVDVHCSKGTYVRVLAEDIGRALGCGAYLTALRRTAAGTLHVSQAIDLKELEMLEPDQRPDRLLPASLLLTALPRVDLDGRSARDLLDGKHPAAADIVGEGEVQAWGPGEVFLGVAKAVRGAAGKRLVPVRLMSPFVLP